MEHYKIKVGAKVVPKSKSAGADKQNAYTWQMLANKEVNYLYVTRIDLEHLVLDTQRNSGNGDYYLASDVEPYRRPTPTKVEDAKVSD